MQNVSTLVKILAVVAVVLILPSVVSAFTPQYACEPPHCAGCSPTQYDCTDDWSLDNPVTAFFFWLMGINYHVCCEQQ